MKRCSKCGVEKELTQFWSNAGRLRSSCKVCERARNDKYKRERPEVSRQASVRWRKNHPEQTATQNHRGKLRKYGVTETQYLNLVRDQGGVCAICGDVNTSGMRLAVDHSHRTGAIRGLLCNRCNAALGMLMNDPERCLKAALYLESRGG
jgi:hypothetical protein